jgi:hypothetical protein
LLQLDLPLLKILFFELTYLELQVFALLLQLTLFLVQLVLRLVVSLRLHFFVFIVVILDPDLDHWLCEHHFCKFVRGIFRALNVIQKGPSVAGKTLNHLQAIEHCSGCNQTFCVLSAG